jgi:hypothetical protein
MIVVISVNVLIDETVQRMLLCYVAASGRIQVTKLSLTALHRAPANSDGVAASSRIITGILHSKRTGVQRYSRAQKGTI